MPTLSPIAPDLLAWFSQNARTLPFRQDPTPYHIWVSEIMLQQTRVAAALEYYDRWMKALPTIRDLAECDEEKLHKLWEGLGYYSRVRNLQKAARIVCQEYGGQLPADHKKLLALPSVPRAQRCQALDEALRGRIQPYLLNFLKILTERGQIRALRDCRKEYRARYNEAHGILEATAVAAVPLSEAQKTALTEKLNKLTGKTVQLAVKVDPVCLGGVRLEMGGAEFDGTVQARLDALRRSLAATV